jgi:hypothetical protein
MKDIFDTALGIIGDVRVLLFIAFGSAALLYFPASLRAYPGSSGSR